MSEEKLIPPPQCLGEGKDFGQRCGGKRWLRVEGGFECKACGTFSRGREPDRIDLVAAKCQRCEETFLWKRHHRDRLGLEQHAPPFCRACDAVRSAERHEDAARSMRKKAATLRAQQRRAVARWKPPESQAAAERPRETGRPNELTKQDIDALAAEVMAARRGRGEP